MSTLSEQDERRVITAVKRATVMIDEQGMTPNAAMTKVAVAEKWGENMVNFAACAYNTGRQLAQMKDGKTATEKFADFDVVDPSVVLAGMIRGETKTASAVDPTASVGPIWLEARKTAADSTRVVGKGYDFKQHERSLNNNGAWDTDVKTAADGIFASAVQDHPGLEPGSVQAYNEAKNLDVLFSDNRRLKLAAEDAESTRQVLHTELSNAMHKLASYMKGDYGVAPRFGDVERVCQVYLGKKAEVLLDWIAAKNGVSKEARETRTRGLSYDPSAAPYSLVQGCLKLAEEYVEAATSKTKADEALNTHAKQAADVLNGTWQESFDLIGGVTRTRVSDVTKVAFMLPVAPPAPEPEPVKEAGIFAALSPSVVNNGTRVLFDKAFETAKGDGPLSGRALKYMNTVSDPAQDARIRQIRAMADMSEIMNDPVISSEDPAMVTNIYNNIARMSPRATEQPSVMIPQIRRHLQGQVEPFEIDNLLNTEKNLAATHPSGVSIDPAKALTQFKKPVPAAGK